MSKKMLYALLLMGITVLLLIFNNGKVSVNIGFADITMLKSIAFLIFTSIGLIIGICIK